MFDAVFKVDSFKRSGETKRCLQFEVDFLLFYAQNERKLSESNVRKVVRGVGPPPDFTGKNMV
jgi:hypothetical protein